MVRPLRVVFLFSGLFLLTPFTLAKSISEIDSLASTRTKTNVEPFSWLETNVLTADDYIIPRYQALAKSAQSLSDEIDRLCELEKPVVLNEKVQDQFELTYNNWAEIQHIKFGPISFLKRLERLQFWPDKHNVGGRQIRDFLAELESGKSYSLQELQTKSVAVQGMSALERLLYSVDEKVSKTECQLASLVAQNIAAITSELDTNWRESPVDFAKEFALADHGEGTYSSNDEVVNLMAESLVTQLLLISEYKLGRALPQKEGGRVYKRRLEAWRSELSFGLLITSLDSLYSFYQQVFQKRLEAIKPGVNETIDKQFKKVVDLSSSEVNSMAELLESKDGVEQLVSLKDEVKKLELMIRNEMFTELGFNTRFNALDGD